ncbi:sodium-dependent phosphate transporter 2 [Morus notabilis]|uniref:sodium-dependent phosphate transporter 2 n=1 Tax=Morus notabilis TaxID=981085 RepID=UPI000CED15C2|nr:sodium-dependent phosphate transporter 2 [Morus notabilis]
MSLKNESVTLDFATKTVGNWKETYQWIPIFGAFAAITTSFLAGGNNLPAPFATPVGSGALTLLKAFIMACVIYVPGAAFASYGYVNDIYYNFLEERQPDAGFLMWSFVIVLVTAAIWLALATYLELPVSSQQSIQGAFLGTILVTEGFSYIPIWNKNENHNFKGGGLVWIALEWTVAPLVACFCAFLLFIILKTSVLRHENAEKRILVFLPIDYGASAGLLCFFLLYQVIPNINLYSWAAAVAVIGATVIGAVLSLVIIVPLATKKYNTTKNYRRKRANMSQNNPSAEGDPQEQACNIKVENANEDLENALKDFMQMRVLETVYEEDEKSWPSPDAAQHDSSPTHDPSLIGKSSTEQTAPFKQLLQSTPNRLVQARNFQKLSKSSTTENVSEFIRDFAKSTCYPAIEYDRHTLIRHALAEKYDEVEDFFSFPQLLASCMFALIQSASEIAPLLSSYANIQYIFFHRERYSRSGEDGVTNAAACWFRAIGGFSAAVGFFLCGFRLTKCLGGKLTYVSNSRGLASQLSTVIAIIVVSRFKLPVSSVHVFVGSLVGLGIADDPKNVNWKLLLKFVCGWVMTLVFCCGVAYVMFSASIHSPAYVVP